MPPTAPDPVTPLTSPAAPAAPLVVLARPAGAAPTVPDLVLARPAASAPASPTAVTTIIGPGDPDAPPRVMTLGTVASWIVSGTLTPNSAGRLYPVSQPRIFNIYPGRPQYTTDGDADVGWIGQWVELSASVMVVPADATLEQIAPKDGHPSSNSFYLGGTVLVVNNQGNTDPKNYWLISNSGNPKWVLYPDNNTDQGATVITAGRTIVPYSAQGGSAFFCGLGLQWQASASTAWVWKFTSYVDNVGSGFWTGVGTTPQTATWSTGSGTTGTPIFTSLPLAPGKVVP